MIAIQPLVSLDTSDIQRIVAPYVSAGVYRVTYHDSPTDTSFALHYQLLPEQVLRTYHHFDAPTLHRYTHILQSGCSFGAYDADLLVGLLIAEPQEWNRSLSVWEFHVAPTHRRRGIGRRLMAAAEDQARRSGLRTIVCETQNTNAAAIMVYRKLGFMVEGIDLSLYSNTDYPDGEVAIFLKRRLQH